MSKQQHCASEVLIECQRIAFKLSDTKPGDSIKKQILKATRNAGGVVDYGTIWRAWRLRGGPRVLAKLREAELRAKSRAA